jgi:hypothetical protein
MTRKHLVLAAALGLSAVSLCAQEAAKPQQTLEQRVASMQHHAGLLGLDYDAKSGKIFLEVPLTADAAHTRSDEMIYVVSLPHGVGSNDLGLDRGQLGGWGGGGAGSLVYFERSGEKLLLLEPNLAFRSSSNDVAERNSVSQSFAESVLWGFKVEADSADGRSVLVDATDFFVRDAHGVAQTLGAMQQGTYRFDATRSAPVPELVKAFPKNIAVESTITLTTDSTNTGRYVRDVTPDAQALTVHERETFVALPPPGFTPRHYSPRAGYFDDAYRDYSAPLGGDFANDLIVRHRLIKKDPNCRHACEAVTPLQYYVDRGAPEPIRSALVEGAHWWDAAFQAAGWAPGTFKVDVLPEGADPMDIRYNIIQWVHRYTRGWSYGAFIADPRTGEIIKGQVTLGSLRGRQDYLIAEALLAPYAHGKTYTAQDDPMLAMVLQRLRQLAAHETGHTLGLAHNFAASAWPHPVDETTSVMDYPHPYVTLDKDGVPDLTHAYPVGIGVWDKTAIDFGYREFDEGGKRVEDAAAEEAILAASEKTGMEYITDGDARPQGGAHPQAHLWDNGTDPATELDRVLTVRAAAMARFGEDNIKPGTDLAQMEDTFVPLYLFHRYQAEAAVKEIGGLDYRYNVRPAGGEAGQMLPQIVSDADQDHAFASVLKTLSPEVLAIPERLLAIFPPRPPELARTQESLPSNTSVTFDPVASAESAADMTLDLLLNPARANRIVEDHARGHWITLAAYLQKIYSAEWETEAPAGLAGTVQHDVALRTIEAMLRLAGSPELNPATKALVDYKLGEFAASLAKSNTSPAAEASMRIHEYLTTPEKFVAAKPMDAPPGMPIGDDEDEF